MKILYLSCHSILEYDELKLFEELGYDYFSLGSYIIPTKPVDAIRPALHKEVDPDLLSKAPDRMHLTKEFVDPFDVIIIMHGDVREGNWITDNWEAIKHKRVIWRTIGQSIPTLEAKLKPFRAQGLEVVRYSPREQAIEGNIGCDALIRFYKDENEFCGYSGLNPQIITFSQNIKQRAEHCCYDAVMKTLEPFKGRAKIYGRDNENLGELFGGFLTYNEMRQTYRDNRVYFYGGTQPASYTLNFIEALMTGIPVVALGAKYANSLKIAGDTYEVPDIIMNGVNGFCSDDINEIQDVLTRLLNNRFLAMKIGNSGRNTAIELFGKEKVKKQWKTFLEK